MTVYRNLDLGGQKIGLLRTAGLFGVYQSEKKEREDHLRGGNVFLSSFSVLVPRGGGVHEMRVTAYHGLGNVERNSLWKELNELLLDLLTIIIPQISPLFKH